MQPLSESEPREEELAAFADGTLAPERRAAVEELVARSPELTERLAEQRLAHEVVTHAAAAVDAPARVRAQVEARRGRTTRRRYALGSGLAIAAAAAIALVLVLVLPANVGGPSVAEAAVLGTRAPMAPAPTAASPTLLAQSVGGVPFPYWAKKFGWKATGVRKDMIGGRQATTVFYEKAGRRVAYTIVAGDALATPKGSHPLTREGTDLRLLTVNGHSVVTWERLGRTCILSGLDDPATLTKLAAWKGKGTVQF